MQLPSKAISSLVPPEPPPVQYNRPEAIELATTIKDDTLRNSYLWAAAVLSSLNFRHPFGSSLLDKNPSLLRVTHISAGFIYVSPTHIQQLGPDIPTFESFVFGAYALVTSDEERPEQLIVPITIGNRTMPLVINFGRLTLHGCPTHPPGGTGCCWVEDNSGKAAWTKGIVVSRHVVSHLSMGTAVSLSHSVSHFLPTTGWLADIDACTIDAAIVGINPINWPPALASLTITPAIAPGTSGVIDGSHTYGSGSVLRIFQNPTYYGSLFGQRVITDFYGVPGDSGTLLKDSSGSGMGVYIGTIPDGAGGFEGIFQDLKQVEHYFKLNLYY